MTVGIEALVRLIRTDVSDNRLALIDPDTKPELLSPVRLPSLI